MTNVAWITPVVAARLMGTGPKEAVHACGLSVATSAVLNTWLRPTHTIPMIKGVAVGLVLERALEAAELARLGVTATEDALETAFSRLLPDGPTGVVESRLKQLGSRWTTTRNLIKVYPAQLYTQPAIEAALGLYQNGIRADRVRKLILYATETFAPASRVRRKRLHPQVGRLRITVPLT